MKKIIISGLMILVSFISVSQEKVVVNDKNAQERQVSGYSQITVSGGIDLYLSPDDREVVVVSANDEKFRDRIVTRVVNERLEIYFDNKGIRRWPSNMGLKAYVSFKTLNRIRAGGASDVYVNGIIRADEFELDLNGASDFKGAIEARVLTLKQSGSSDSRLSGRAEKMSVDASGASDVKAYDFSADFCDADASGASSISVTVNKELNAKASGASDINFKGEGLIRDIRSSGASSVKKRS